MIESPSQVLLGFPTDPAALNRIGIARYEPASGHSLAHCGACGCEVTLGPLQAKLKQERPSLKIGCALCLAIATKRGVEIAGTVALGAKGGTFHFTNGTVLSSKQI